MRMPSTTTGGAVPASGRPAPAQGRLARLRAAVRHVPVLARQHWLFTALLTAGLVLRVLAQVAYRPALLYIDSTKYLLGAYPGDDPTGYQFVIKPVGSSTGLKYSQRTPSTSVRLRLTFHVSEKYGA